MLVRFVDVLFWLTTDNSVIGCLDVFYRTSLSCLFWGTLFHCRGQKLRVRRLVNITYFCFHVLQDKRKDAVKKVIAAMTVGKDVSSLFTDVVNCMQTENLELKKLVYLYLINYAKSQPDLAILAVNTFVKVKAGMTILLFVCVPYSRRLWVLVSSFVFLCFHLFLCIGSCQDYISPFPSPSSAPSFFFYYNLFHVMQFIKNP